MASSPKVKPLKIPEMDRSIGSWVLNMSDVMKFPFTVLAMAGLIVTGAFVEIAPRRSLEFLDNIFGSILFFIVPFLCISYFDWPTGLLAAVVSLIVFTRLQKQDSDEGFSDKGDDDKEVSTKVVSNPHRWFIERVLGEEPVAISSDRIITSAVQNQDNKSSSSSSHNK
jgi:hypothetical protein